MLTTAKIICDSISPDGIRITTFELEYPRFIHSEFMTHRMFSRNAASSRAIPVGKMMELTTQQDVRPLWTAEQKGMQGVPLHSADVGDADAIWIKARESAIMWASMLNDMGVHKQNVNRLLEPFQMIKVVLTATEYANFFALRCHPDAQPEIQILARLMQDEMEHHKPMELGCGEWHTPYVHRSRVDGILTYLIGDTDLQQLRTADAVKVSASCCAQVSYRLLDDSLGKALAIYDRLAYSVPVHASPFEHQARCVPKSTQNTRNFTGWLQHRAHIKGETIHV